MKLKRVLIITYYWPPAGGGGVQRWVKFVKYLRDFGWEPIVFTAKNAEYPIIDTTLANEIPPDVEVLKVPVIEPYQLYKRFVGKDKNERIDANFLSQGKKLGWKDRLAVWIRGNLFIPDARSFWINPSVRFLDRYLISNRIDAMISTGPPHSCHMIALGVRRRHALPWIVDYRDPWTQIDYFDDLRLTSWARNLHYKMEKQVLDTCDTVVTVGKTMAHDLNALTTTPKKVITNGFDEADRNEDENIVSSDFSIVYIGTMNDSRNPLVLWKALSELKEENHPIIQRLRVKLVGKPEVVVRESVIQQDVLDLVEFLGYVSHQEAIEYQNKASVLLLIINHTSNNKSILTGKIFEYLASGRPILCIGPEDGDAADILHSSGHQAVFDYEDVKGVKSWLANQFEKAGDEHTESLPLQPEVLQYSRKNLTEKLAALLDELTLKKCGS